MGDLFPHRMDLFAGFVFFPPNGFVAAVTPRPIVGHGPQWMGPINRILKILYISLALLCSWLSRTEGIEFMGSPLLTVHMFVHMEIRIVWRNPVLPVLP